MKQRRYALDGADLHHRKTFTTENTEVHRGQEFEFDVPENSVVDFFIALDATTKKADPDGSALRFGLFDLASIHIWQ